MNITKLSFYFLLLMFVMVNGAFAQNITLSGKIISAKTRINLSYVNIRIPSIAISTVTNEDGEFDLKFPEKYDPQDTIVLTCIGYKPQTMKIGDALKAKPLTIQLEENIEQLKEVTIKPLTLKELIDSITTHNQRVFASPIKLNGYYREFVFTNNKCNEYADALIQYYYNAIPKPEGQLKIVASRCEKAIAKKIDSNNFEETYINSVLSPIKLFKFSSLNSLIAYYFLDKGLNNYTYKLSTNESNSDVEILIYPLKNIVYGTSPYYSLHLFLADDFTIKNLKLEIPEVVLTNQKEFAFLGLHQKTTNFIIEAGYNNSKSGIYPGYLKWNISLYQKGKVFGNILDQSITQKSEFVITGIDTANTQAIPKNEIYKKGNICKNGSEINTEMLKQYNFIKRTKRDSIAIHEIYTN